MLSYSILMPVYLKDKAEYVATAIESMLEQTYKPEQYVIVEDGPIPDELEGVLDSYCRKQPELFTRIKLEKNCGLATALNIGLQHCRNDLVARMDADDISLPKRCEKQINLFKQNSKLVICGTNIDEFSVSTDNIRTSRVVPEKYQDILKFSRKRMPFNHPTVMYKKSAVMEYGGYSVELKRKEDFDLFSRMLLGGCYAQNVGESLLYYRASKENYARRKNVKTLVSAFRVYRKHFSRGGCNMIEFLIIFSGEFLFYILPVSIMRKLSDKLLRKTFI